MLRGHGSIVGWCPRRGGAGREPQIQLGSDQLLGTIYDRRLKVASVLKDSASKTDWEAIRRDSTSVSQGASEGLASNDSLDHFRSSIEPVGGFR